MKKEKRIRAVYRILNTVTGYEYIGMIIGLFLLIILIMSLSYARGYKAGKEVKDKIEKRENRI